ncbi:MAG TPA: glycosyltransferase, partial [Bacteroidota bacterium]|nr:glycosyltransferase [Bacteroidota bacterium]
LVLNRWRSHVEAGRAYFTGYVDAGAAVAASSILVCPNQVAEPFGRSFLEGGVHQKPVVAMNIPAFNELIEHGHTGWLLPPDARAWASKIAALAADRGAVQEAGRAAEQKARASDAGSHARVLMTLYDEVLRCA